MEQPRPSSHHRLDQHLATLSITLCHTQELIALAYQLSCELSPQADPKAILTTSGRLATLMHVAAQQLTSAQGEACALAQAVQAPPPKPPAPGRRDH